MQIVIVDTNVLVAGLITANAQSPTARIVDGMLRGDVVFLLSPKLLREFRAVLMRTKLVAVHGLADHDIDQLLTELAANALWREPPARSAAPDSEDSHLWALLDAEPSAKLITGDRLLLARPHSTARVIQPADYLAIGPPQT
jgi:putative PIN family toxin of toxin-antitoxin system